MKNNIFLLLFCITNFSYAGIKGNNISASISRTNNESIMLTIDFCDGKFDKNLINFLEHENIPAILFVTAKWINKNRDIFVKLSKNSLFNIQNHGTNHKPCVSSGEIVYGIKGSKNIQEMIDEIKINEELIQSITLNKPIFYRSGTAHYDEKCIEILGKMGYKIIGFSINGDGGARYSQEKTYRIISKAKHGDIILIHGNHPERNSSKGAIRALKELKLK